MEEDIFGKKRSIVGLLPGNLAQIEEKKVENVVIKVVSYNSENLVEKKLNSVEECLAFKDQPGTNLWINVDGLDQVKVIEKLGSYFDIHPLTLEDVLNTGQRPKMEDYDSYIYIVLKIMLLDEEKDEIIQNQVSIIFGYNFILSFQERRVDIFDPLMERLRNPAFRHKKHGVDYIAYSIIDAVIDNYFLVLDHFKEEVEEFEDELINNPTPETLKAIQKYKKEIFILRKSIWPLREMINSLQKTESEIISDNTHVYIRDIYDHTIRVIDSIEFLKETLASMVSVYLSSVNNKLSDIMRVLTLITTIFITLTFIAGVYAMNFDYMPELKIGYPAILFFMASVVAIMLTYFKKKRWI